MMTRDSVMRGGAGGVTRELIPGLSDGSRLKPTDGGDALMPKRRVNVPEPVAGEREQVSNSRCLSRRCLGNRVADVVSQPTD
jgi:hypothetical protein